MFTGKIEMDRDKYILELSEDYMEVRIRSEMTGGVFLQDITEYSKLLETIVKHTKLTREYIEAIIFDNVARYIIIGENEGKITKHTHFFDISRALTEFVDEIGIFYEKRLGYDIIQIPEDTQIEEEEVKA